MNKKLLSIVVTIAALSSIFLVVSYNKSAMENHLKIAPAEAAKVYPNVVVIEVNKAEYQAQITGYGEAQAKNTIELTTEIAGRVDTLVANFATGRVFKQGQVIANLNRLSYEQTAANAQASVAQAKLALLEEQREGEQALAEWLASGMDGQPDSPLVLRKPQLESAEADLANAQKTLLVAQRELALTTIKVPFDAVVLERNIQPGTYLQQGAVVATLASTDHMEIRVPLSAYQWQNLLPANAEAHLHWPVAVSNIDGSFQWQGYVDRAEQHLDNSNRQRALIVVVDKPLAYTEPLLSGSFVQVLVQGRQLTELWQVPASAITQDGLIWFADSQGLLDSFVAHKRYEQGDFAYVTPPQGMSRAAIVKRPLTTYTKGMRINPVAEDVI